jgi:hypothetical protein
MRLPSTAKGTNVQLQDLPRNRWVQLPGSVVEVCSPDRDVLIYRRDDGVWDLSVTSTLLLVRKANRPRAVWPITPLPIRSGNDLVEPGMFDSDEELEEFLAGVRADLRFAI